LGVLTASLFVGVVATVVAMVALQSGVDALVSVGTAELVQATGHAAAAVLVPPGATVQVAVAALLLRHTGTGEAGALRGGGSGGGVAEHVRVLALAVSWKIQGSSMVG